MAYLGGLDAASVRKNPAEVSVRKCNEFNAKMPYAIRVVKAHEV